MIMEDKTITHLLSLLGRRTSWAVRLPSTITAVHADSREVLKSFIWWFRSVRSLHGVRGLPLLEARLPCCGEVRRYWQEYEIPSNDVGPCSCGNWFIKYREQPFQVIF
ncbi:hypothetical protein LCGC14_1456190 [marine sediment metagenome]|uniref:Uncharacterized protein n=1 Tax=marine sediment metagenome TaxID=412755 RepID=A0A0F9JGD6_9ZZZZ